MGLNSSTNVTVPGAQKNQLVNQPAPTPPPAPPTPYNPVGGAVNYAINALSKPGEAPPSSAPTDPNNNLLAPGDSEKFYHDTSGEYTTPGNLENLVKQGIGGGLNDYYEFANNKLNDQFASMGGANSGARIRAGQELRANQAHDMETLAGQADAEHLGRLQAGQGAAGASDTGRLGRLGELWNSTLGLSTGEGNMAGGFYANAAAYSNPFTQEGINAGVQQSTINPGQQFFKDNISLGGSLVKAYYGGGMGAGGGGGNNGTGGGTYPSPGGY